MKEAPAGKLSNWFRGCSLAEHPSWKAMTRPNSGAVLTKYKSHCSFQPALVVATRKHRGRTSYPWSTSHCPTACVLNSCWQSMLICELALRVLPKLERGKKRKPALYLPGWRSKVKMVFVFTAFMNPFYLPTPLAWENTCAASLALDNFFCFTSGNTIPFRLPSIHLQGNFQLVFLFSFSISKCLRVFL